MHRGVGMHSRQELGVTSLGDHKDERGKSVVWKIKMGLSDIDDGFDKNPGRNKSSYQVSG